MSIHLSVPQPMIECCRVDNRSPEHIITRLSVHQHQCCSQPRGTWASSTSPQSHGGLSDKLIARADPAWNPNVPHECQRNRESSSVGCMREENVRLVSCPHNTYSMVKKTKKIHGATCVKGTLSSSILLMK